MSTLRVLARDLVEQARQASVAARKARRRQETEPERARRQAGICRDCDLPIVGRTRAAKFCAECRRKDQRRRTIEHARKTGYAAKKRYDARNRQMVLAKARAYRESAEVRERRNAYKRAWRQGSRDKIRAQKRRSALRNWRTNGKHVAEWRKRVAAGLHTPSAAPRNDRGERLCLTPGCNEVLTGRPKLCAACRNAGHRSAA